VGPIGDSRGTCALIHDYIEDTYIQDSVKSFTYEQGLLFAFLEILSSYNITTNLHFVVVAAVMLPSRLPCLGLLFSPLGWVDLISEKLV